MTKWIIFGLLTFMLMVSSPIAFLYLLNHGNPFMNHLIEKEATAHLANKKGYKKKDILKQFPLPSYEMINQDYFETEYEVIFKDEPSIQYYYGKKKYSGKIVQFCEKETKEGGIYQKTIVSKTMHSESTCISKYENRLN